MVLIALLPKADWGFRPIGLIPFSPFPILWMRARREAIKEWRARNAGGYLYVGMAKGASGASWKQAALAEIAAAVGGSIQYA